MRVERHYDAPPTAVVTAALDPAFLAARGARFGGGGEAAVQQTPAGTVVTLPRQLPLEHVPGPFKRLVGHGRLTQVDTWTDHGDAGATARWVVDAAHMPLDLHGTHEIAADGAGSRSVLTAHVTVHLPFGGRLAKQVEERLAELVTAELQFLADWVDRAE